MSVLLRQSAVNLARAVALVLFTSSSAALAGVEAHTSFYLDTYGPADPSQNERVGKAQKIFSRLKRVAGQSVSSARLVIVNSQTSPWAVALADGNVVLSAGGLDIIYEGYDAHIADARLAFVLGHELAHLSNRDLWHHQVFVSLAGNTGTKSLKQVRQLLKNSAHNHEEIKQRELKADEIGFVYASLAGYNTNALFESFTQPSFLQEWVDKTHAWVDDEHHSPELRTSFIRNRLQQLRLKVVLFDYGVRLAHFGRFEDALYFMDAFRREYPSRQVLSNMGYVHLQLARKAMSPSVAYRFWYPTLLETHSGVPELARQFPEELAPEVRDHLEQAAQLLDEATRIDSLDIVSRLNLVATYLYLSEPFKARAVVEEALRTWPDSVQLKAMRSLVLLEQEPQVDMWSHVTKSLEKLIENMALPPDNVLYNLGMLYSERGRHGQATIYWDRLLARLNQLPENYQIIVCVEAGSPAVCENKNLRVDPNKRRFSERYTLPVSLGTHMDSADARKSLRNWQQSQWTIGPFSVRIFEHGDHGSVLAIDHHAEMIVVSAEAMPSPNGLKREHGEPDISLPLGAGIVWSYGSSWSAFLENDRVSEIWVAR